MKSTILFAISSLLIITILVNFPTAYGAQTVPDDLSNVGIDQLGVYTTELQMRLEQCKVQSHKVSEEITAIEQERQSHPKSEWSGLDGQHIEPLSKVGIKLKEVKDCVSGTDLDLERLRAEILKRLTELDEKEPDPTQRDMIRAKFQGYKVELGEHKGKVNTISEGFRGQTQAYGATIAPAPVVIMDTPFSEMNQELDSRIVQRLQRLDCGSEQMATRAFQPSDDKLDKLARKIEVLRGRLDGECRWYDGEIVQQFDEALGGRESNPQNTRAAVMALGPRIWLLIDAD